MRRSTDDEIGTRDGKPKLTAPVPRMKGKPDLSGVSQAERTPEREFARVLGNDFATLRILGLKPENEPLRPEAAAIMKERTKLRFPGVECLPAGIPANIFLYDFKII